GDVQAGKGGEWLLDPTNIEIVSEESNTGVFESGKGTSSALDADTAFNLSPNVTTGSKVSASKIAEKLKAGTNVTVKTSGTHTPEGAAEGGNITVSADITKDAGADATLTLEADKNITVNKNITSSQGKLNVNLLGAGSSNGKVTLNATAKIDANGGDVRVARMTPASDTAHELSMDVNGSISAGNITLEGNASSWTVAVRGSLNATENITVSGDSVNQVGVILLERANLKATTINVSGNSQKQRGVVLNNVTLNASGSVNITGGSDKSTGLDLSNGSMVTAGQNISLNGSSTSGSGLEVVNTTLNATGVNITGASTSGSTGFSLTNLTLAGGVEHGANVNLSSAGSGNRASNVLGNGIFDATNIKALMKKGIENNTKISAAGLNLGGGEAEANWEEDYAVSVPGSKKGGWIFDGATVSKTGNINLSGVNFVNSTLTAANLTIDNKEKSLTLTNATLNASSGNISLTANGGLLISGSGNTSPANITAQSGNITISGNKSSGGTAVTINNVSLSATSGNISVNGTSASSGIELSGNVTLNALNNLIEGISTSKSDTDFLNAGVLTINGFNGTFVGNTTINATGRLQGLMFRPRWGGAPTLTFRGGSSFINAKAVGSYATGVGAGFYIYPTLGVPTIVNVNVPEATSALVINASANTGGGFLSVKLAGAPANDKSNSYGVKFTGAGDVSVLGNAVQGDGVQLTALDNTGLSGNLTITGTSTSGAGINIPKFADINVKDASISGTSSTGGGIQINSGDTQSKTVKLTNVSLGGTSSGGGPGVKIDGSNVNITGGSVTGTSASGEGVKLSSTGTNYTIDGAAVTGISASGSGVSLAGNVSANGETTITGNTTTGTGVNISGALTSTDNNVTVTGDANGTGHGVYLNGTVTGGSVTGDSAKSAGVMIGSGAHVEGSAEIVAKTRSLIADAMAAGEGVAIPEDIKNSVKEVASDEQKLAKILESLLESNPDFLAELVKKNPDLLALIKGDKGDRGETGPAGPQGPRGERGE
ncbi:hypothetical protein NF634_004572, partial [Salmonella enterica]|nr:hypothetical protein [Salmonella enterica]